MAKKSVTAEVPFAVPQWPATRVEMWPLDKIKPYPKNPRTHPPEQIDALAAAMANDGVTMPILVDEAGEIIAGHGRRLAAEKSNFKEYPVVIARGWTETQKRAARLRDNQLGLLSEWDDELLRVEVAELKLADFDLPMLGFSNNELSKLIETPLDEEDRELTAEEQEVVNKAWRVLVKDWLANANRSIETGFVSTNYTRGSLMVHFTRALFHGDDIPRGATTAYNPHRIFKSTSNKPFVDVFKKAMTNDNVLRGIQFVISGRPLFDSIISGTLGIHGYRLAGDFPVLLARDLIDEYTPEGGSVLDPCHGWGGRMLGFMLSDAGGYHGYDTDEQTVRGVSEMFADLRTLRPDKKASLICQPFEDAKLAPKSFDFALTSPPYYDTEQYGGELSSWKRYGTFDDWVSGFFKPLIEKTAGAIKPGGVFALQIGNQSYPLESKAREIVGGCGFVFEEKRTTDMVNNYTGTDAQEGEIVLILRKSERAIKAIDKTPAPAKKLNGGDTVLRPYHVHRMRPCLHRTERVQRELLQKPR